MARLVDTLVDEDMRRLVKSAFMGLNDKLSLTDREALADFCNVRRQTLDGWMAGRGEPVPKGALGYFAYSSLAALDESWSNRIMVGQLLKGWVSQTSGRRREKLDTYHDDISGKDFVKVCERAKQYMTHNAEGTPSDPGWQDLQWRSLSIRPTDRYQRGTYDLIVEYSRDYDPDFNPSYGG